MDVTDAYEWRGRDVIDAEGDKIGFLEEIYLDTDTGEPEWATVNTGLLKSSSFVPLAQAEPARGRIIVPYGKDQVKDAPWIDAEGDLSEEEEQRLYSHYGIDYSAGSGTDQAVGYDTSGPTTDDAMTRSEEELHVGTAQRERGRVRLRKYVVTEEVQQTVPVQREEVRIEREPITEDNADKAFDGPEISEEEHEVVLHEEEVVVEKRAVPKERVRLAKDTVIEEETVSEEIRKEQIDVEGDDR